MIKVVCGGSGIALLTP
ncbi:hypothetical protein NDJ40_01685 [Vibrio alginolyticus]|nr:hypothetical protein [Vibrio alginolyticus]